MSANFDDLLAEHALSNATPASIPIIRRSAYLADALRSLQSSPEAIRSPAQLISKLLAEAITQHASSKANDKLATAQAADQASLANLHFAGIPGLDGSAPAPQAAMADAINPPAQPPQQAPIQQNPLPPISPQATQSGLSDAERAGISFGPDELKALGQATWGEARGESPAGQQAVAATAINRAADSNRGPTAPDQGLSIQDVLSAPNQFAGYSPRAQQQSMNSPQMQKIMANLQPLLSGQTPEPSNQPVGFYAPQGMPNGQPASWDHGQPRMAIDHQLFFGRQPGAMQQPPMQMAQNAPPMPEGGPAQPPPFVLPYQTASNGPTPPPPQSAMQAPGAPAFPPPLPAPSGGAAPPVSGPSPGMGGSAPIPTGPGPTPQEIQTINQLKADPRTLPLAIQMADKIKQRMSTPIELQRGDYFGPDGHVRSAAQFTDVPGMSPSEVVQRGPDNQIHISTHPGVQGAVPEGMVLDPATNSYKKIQTQAQQTFRIPGASGSYVVGPDGVPKKVADDSYTVKDLSNDLSEIYKSDQYKALDLSTNMFNAAVQASHRPGGISDVELRDFAARQFSGGVARQFNVGALDNAQGPWANLKQFVPELISGQHLSPGARQAILQAMHDDSVQAQNAFNGYAKSKMAFSAAQGADLSPFIEPLIRPIPDVPQIATIPNGMPGGQNGTGPGQPGGGPGGSGNNGDHASAMAGQPTREEVLAESQRNQAGRAPTTPHIRTYNPKTGRLE